MQAVAYKNGGLNNNWGALYLSVRKNLTCDKALLKMGVVKRQKELPGTRDNSKRMFHKIDIDVLKANELYSTGMSLKEVGEVLGVNWSIVRKRLIEHGTKLRDRSYRRTGIGG